jgi:MoaA/NifB/PqqE/SkfB family radical SAM enzyme
MPLANYKKVLDKLLADIPFLRIVDLYEWGEPLLNPDLPDIIRYSNAAGVGCAFSTNLNDGRYLEETIKARPMEIRISASGYGPGNYEIAHTGGKWENLHRNMASLSEYIKKYETNTAVQVWYHVNKLNTGEYKDMKALCDRLGFVLHWTPSMVFPCFAMDYIDKKPLSPEAQKAIDLMLIGMDDLIAACEKEHNTSCQLIWCLPVINWDMSVMTCCNSPIEILAPNYLEVSLEEIIERRNKSPLCDKCVEYSLHRYFTGRAHLGYIEQLLKDAGGEN